MFAFFKKDGDFYFEAGDVTPVCSTFGDRTDGAYVWKETELEFVGASALAATSCVIVASLLF